LPVIFADTRKV